MDVKKVAKMSRLSLTDEENKKFEQDLKEVLKMFEILKKIDVEDEEIIMHPTPLSNITREDEVGIHLKVEEALKNTENKEDNYFVGPKTIEE